MAGRGRGDEEKPTSVGSLEHARTRSTMPSRRTAWPDVPVCSDSRLPEEGVVANELISLSIRTQA